MDSETGNLVGQRLGRYHIEGSIGRGGMAVVYRARDQVLEREVAIKLISKERFPPEMLERVLKRFEREAKSLAQLDHPHIVQVLDYGEYDGAPYLVLKYLSGGTLEQVVGHPLPYPEAARLLIPIAQALAYAHERHIIHRDVKPSNILFSDSRHPMLGDFGIAKLLDDASTHGLTESSAVIGTPAYMAPEQAMGRPIDARTDLYALGVVFYELVTGRKPFEADTPMSMAVMHATEPLPSPKQFVPDLPDAVEQILLRALAKQPAERYPDMAQFLAALTGLAAMNQAHAADAPTPEKNLTGDTGDQGKPQTGRIARLENRILAALAEKDFDDAESLLVNLQNLGERGAESATRLRQELTRLRQQEAQRLKRLREEAELAAVEAAFHKSLADGDLLEAEALLESCERFGERDQGRITRMRQEYDQVHREALRRKAQNIHLPTAQIEEDEENVREAVTIETEPGIGASDADASNDDASGDGAFTDDASTEGEATHAEAATPDKAVNESEATPPDAPCEPAPEALHVEAEMAGQKTGQPRRKGCGRKGCGVWIVGLLCLIGAGLVIALLSNLPNSDPGQRATLIPTRRASQRPPATNVTSPAVQAATASATQAEFMFYQASVTALAINMRKGPGVVYVILASYKQDTVFEVLGRNEAGDWLIVQADDGHTGWVLARLVSFTFEVEQLVIFPAPPTPIQPTDTPIP